jgi:predicted O-methyltransferase YrrM
MVKTDCKKTDLQVNPVLAKVYEDRLYKGSPFRSETKPLEGYNIYMTIIDNKFTRTLEIGFAMGASSVYICQAHKDLDISGFHIAIDPYQKEQWKNNGLSLVKDCHLSKYMDHLAEKSYIALPTLYKAILHKELPKFQLIYIDGWHTFDYTLVDFFYSDLILEVGGYIIIDDAKHPGPKKCISYIMKNYCRKKNPRGHYRKIKTCKELETQAIFQKISEDKRPWNFHIDF